MGAEENLLEVATMIADDEHPEASARAAGTLRRSEPFAGGGAVRPGAEGAVSGKQVVPLHLRAITGRGEPYENDYVFIFRIRDGRIAEVWENLDTLYLHTKLHA